MDSVDLGVDIALDGEVTDIPTTPAPLPTKPSREELKRRLRAKRSEKRDLRTRHGRDEMLVEAGDSLAGMSGEELKATLRGISQQTGVPVNRLQKKMGITTELENSGGKQ